MPATESTLQKPRILIIDDDATMRLLMRDSLTDELYEISEAEDGTDGLARINELRPDLVLLDVRMPGIDGFDVCTAIRRNYGNTDISIVMVTALEDPESIEKAYHLGATDFISKPINWDTFPYRIQYLIKARNAIVQINSYKLHLEYMEHISRIITQNKNKDVIMQETMFAMLDIFSADRAILIKPDEFHENEYIVDCEVTNATKESFDNHAAAAIYDSGLLVRASNSEYPVLTRYNDHSPAPSSNFSPEQQLVSALHLKYTQNWYLIIQQNTPRVNWTDTEIETFYKISLRLTNMLSLHLLTEDLSRSERLLKQAQKIGHLGNWSWNVANNCLTWSDEVYYIYEVDRNTYLPDIDKYFAVEFEEDKARSTLFAEIRGKKKSLYQIDHRIRLADNNIKWLHEQCIGIYDKKGRLLEINGVVQDITESHIRKEQQAHDSKMDAIGKLTSGLAHDFGNLMTVVKGNLDLLEDELMEHKNIDSDSRQLLEDACSAVNDSVELTRQLLAFSRRKSVSPVYVNIEKTVNKFRNLFKNTVGDRISMVVDIDRDLPEIYVNPSQFESSLLNVIINARNAMPDGGSITINVQVVGVTQMKQIIQHDLASLTNECVCVSIKDNGMGMTEDVLRQAVEPFYTTRTNQGTGLGLSTVYGFLKQSGGELIIKSHPGMGTTVYMLFPIIEGNEQQQARQDAVKLPGDRHATILIVEDRDSVRQFAVRCLYRPGITLLQASDAAAARSLLKTNKIDLLFTDIVMPGDMNGQELADWASIKYSDIKILLTTAMLDSNTKHIEIDNSFPMLEKPYSKSELIEAVTTCLG